MLLLCEKVSIKVSNGTEVSNLSFLTSCHREISDVVFQLFRFHKTINMKRITMVLVSMLMLTLEIHAASAATSGNVSSTSEMDWTPVMDAIIQVESKGDPKAKSGNSVGVMQITPILVAECNNILKRKKSMKRYTLADRYNVAKSKEMFLLIQSVYNPLNSIERAIRSWNGGNHYSKKRTQRYFEKVMKLLKK